MSKNSTKKIIQNQNPKLNKWKTKHKKSNVKQISTIRYEMMMHTIWMLWFKLLCHCVCSRQSKKKKGGKKIYRDMEIKQRKRFYLKWKAAADFTMQWHRQEFFVFFSFLKRCAIKRCCCIQLRKCDWLQRSAMALKNLLYKITLINWIECHSVGKSTKGIKRKQKKQKKQKTICVYCDNRMIKPKPNGRLFCKQKHKTMTNWKWNSV